IANFSPALRRPEALRQQWLSRTCSGPSFRNGGVACTWSLRESGGGLRSSFSLRRGEVFSAAMSSCSNLLHDNILGSARFLQINRDHEPTRSGAPSFRK